MVLGKFSSGLPPWPSPKPNAAPIIGSDPINGVRPYYRHPYDLFDAGLWTIDDNLRIQVAKSDIAASILPGGSHFKLADLHGHPLSFAPQATLRPDPTHLAWHRQHHRKGQATP